jgi:hypothetical protein
LRWQIINEAIVSLALLILTEAASTGYWGRPAAGALTRSDSHVSLLRGKTPLVCQLIYALQIAADPRRPQFFNPLGVLGRLQCSPQVGVPLPSQAPTVRLLRAAAVYRHFARP